MIRAFEPADTDAVVRLWRDCGLTRPWNDPHRDIERKLTVQPELFLVVEDPAMEREEPARAAIIGTAMIGYDGHRGWVSYFAVDAARRGEGHGRRLMVEAERLLVELGCPKIMLMVRSENSSVVELYEHLGYEAESTLILGKRLIPDVTGN